MNPALSWERLLIWLHGPNEFHAISRRTEHEVKQIITSSPDGQGNVMGLWKPDRLQSFVNNCPPTLPTPSSSSQSWGSADWMTGSVAPSCWTQWLNQTCESGENFFYSSHLWGKGGLCQGYWKKNNLNVDKSVGFTQGFRGGVRG